MSEKTKQFQAKILLLDNDLKEDESASSFAYCRQCQAKKTIQDLFACPSCASINPCYYCNDVCQKKHWSLHSNYCERAQKLQENLQKIGASVDKSKPSGSLIELMTVESLDDLKFDLEKFVQIDEYKYSEKTRDFYDAFIKLKAQEAKYIEELKQQKASIKDSGEEITDVDLQKEKEQAQKLEMLVKEIQKLQEFLKKHNLYTIYSFIKSLHDATREPTPRYYSEERLRQLEKFVVPVAEREDKSAELVQLYDSLVYGDAVAIDSSSSSSTETRDENKDRDSSSSTQKDDGKGLLNSLNEMEKEIENSLSEMKESSDSDIDQVKVDLLDRLRLRIKKSYQKQMNFVEEKYSPGVKINAEFTGKVNEFRLENQETLLLLCETLKKYGIISGGFDPRLENTFKIIEEKSQNPQQYRELMGAFKQYWDMSTLQSTFEILPGGNPPQETIDQKQKETKLTFEKTIADLTDELKSELPPSANGVLDEKTQKQIDDARKMFSTIQKQQANFIQTNEYAEFEKDVAEVGEYLVKNGFVTKFNEKLNQQRKKVLAERRKQRDIARQQRQKKMPSCPTTPAAIVVAASGNIDGGKTFPATATVADALDDDDDSEEFSEKHIGVDSDDEKEDDEKKTDDDDDDNDDDNDEDIDDKKKDDKKNEKNTTKTVFESMNKFGQGFCEYLVNQFKKNAIVSRFTAESEKVKEKLDLNEFPEKVQQNAILFHSNVQKLIVSLSNFGNNAAITNSIIDNTIVKEFKEGIDENIRQKSQASYAKLFVFFILGISAMVSLLGIFVAVPTTRTNGTVENQNSSVIDNNRNFNVLHSNSLGLNFSTNTTTELTQLFAERFSTIDSTQNNDSKIAPLQRDLVVLSDTINTCLGRNSTFINAIGGEAKEILKNLLAGKFDTDKKALLDFVVASYTYFLNNVLQADVKNSDELNDVKKITDELFKLVESKYFQMRDFVSVNTKEEFMENFKGIVSLLNNFIKKLEVNNKLKIVKLQAMFDRVVILDNYEQILLDEDFINFQLQHANELSNFDDNQVAMPDSSTSSSSLINNDGSFVSTTIETYSNYFKSLFQKDVRINVGSTIAVSSTSKKLDKFLPEFITIDFQNNLNLRINEQIRLFINNLFRNNSLSTPAELQSFLTNELTLISERMQEDPRQICENMTSQDKENFILLAEQIMKKKTDDVFNQQFVKLISLLKISCISHRNASENSNFLPNGINNFFNGRVNDIILQLRNISKFKFKFSEEYFKSIDKITIILGTYTIYSLLHLLFDLNKDRKLRHVQTYSTLIVKLQTQFRFIKELMKKKSESSETSQQKLGAYEKLVLKNLETIENNTVHALNNSIEFYTRIIGGKIAEISTVFLFANTIENIVIGDYSLIFGILGLYGLFGPNVALALANENYIVAGIGSFFYLPKIGEYTNNTLYLPEIGKYTNNILTKFGIGSRDTTMLRSASSIFQNDVQQRNVMTSLSSSVQLWTLIKAMQNVQVHDNRLYDVLISMTILMPLISLFSKYYFRQVLKTTNEKEN